MSWHQGRHGDDSAVILHAARNGGRDEAGDVLLPGRARNKGLGIDGGNGDPHILDERDDLQHRHDAVEQPARDDPLRGDEILCGECGVEQQCRDVSLISLQGRDDVVLGHADSACKRIERDAGEEFVAHGLRIPRARLIVGQREAELAAGTDGAHHARECTTLGVLDESRGRRDPVRYSALAGLDAPGERRRQLLHGIRAIGRQLVEERFVLDRHADGQPHEQSEANRRGLGPPHALDKGTAGSRIGAAMLDHEGATLRFGEGRPVADGDALEEQAFAGILIALHSRQRQIGALSHTELVRMTAHMPGDFRQIERMQPETRGHDPLDGDHQDHAGMSFLHARL